MNFRFAMSSLDTIFKPASTPAQSVYDLSILVLAICAAIFIVVAGLLTYTIIRFRVRPADDGREPAQVYGSNQIEIAWTVIPILIVVVLTMATARVISAVQNKLAPADALRVSVIGHQWWWEVRYPELGIVTANEVHLPVSRASQPRLSFLELQSVDVVHSFWVPRLAGKTDVIPNRTNLMWIDPAEEGTFLGNCAEYCGTQHANMLLRVIVESPAKFDEWTAQQKLQASSQPQIQSGRALFFSLNCINCHAVNGTPARGTFGPDLTHLMSRDTIGSGVAPMNAETLRAWIKDPHAIKPGNLMPTMQLSEREVDVLLSYLETLK